MDQPPAVALTAFADAWPRAIETEIGAALCAIGRGKDFDFDFFFGPTLWLIEKLLLILTVYLSFLCQILKSDI